MADRCPTAEPMPRAVIASFADEAVRNPRMRLGPFAVQGLTAAALEAAADAVRMAKRVIAGCQTSGCSVLPATDHLCGRCRDALAVIDRWTPEEDPDA